MKKAITLYLEEDNIKKIKNKSKKIDRSLSWLIDDIIQKYIGGQGHE